MLRYISIALLSLSVLFSVAVGDDVVDTVQKVQKVQKERANPATSIISRIQAASVELSDTQLAAIESHGQAMTAAAKPVRESHEIDGEVMKAFRKAKSAARKSGLKGDALATAAIENAELSETQVEGIRELAKLEETMLTKISGELTDGQRAELPKALGGTKMKKGKKKVSDN